MKSFPRPLRFLMATTFFPPHHFGGDAVCVLRLVRALAEAGHRVDVLYSRDAYRLTAHADAPAGAPPELPPSVRIETLNTPRPALSALWAHQLGGPGPAYAGQLEEIFRRPYDVVHFHNVSLLGGPGLLGCSRAPVTLYTAHEYWLICATHVLVRYGREACRRRTCLRCTLHARRPPQWWRFGGKPGGRYLERCLGHLDRLFVPSRFALEQHRQQGLRVPMQVLPHFVPIPAARVEPEPTAKPYFLYVGRLEKLKGVQDLLRLFRRFREAELWIVGEGSHGAELRRAAADLKHVRFLGVRPPESLGPLYAGARALLAPSLAYETFGLTVAEAMAHGTPALVRGHGALAELVAETGAGFAIDSFETADGLLAQLTRRDDLRRELGERGRSEALLRWSQEAHLEAYFHTLSRIAPELATGDRPRRREEEIRS